MRRSLLIGLTGGAIASLGVASAAHAQDRGVAYAGGSVGDGANGYAGALVALPGGELGKGLAVRAGVSGGEYRYRAGERIDARYVGAEVALAMQASGDWGYGSISAGGRVTDTRLSPVDPGNRLRGTRFDAVLQTDGALGNTWRLGWFGSYGINDRTYIAQARASHLVHGASGTRLGLEGGTQGDRTYNRDSLGAFGSTRLAPKWEGLISGGATFQEGRDAKPYVTLAVSRVF